MYEMSMNNKNEADFAFDNTKKINLDMLLEMKTIIQSLNDYLKDVQNRNAELQQKIYYDSENIGKQEIELWNNYNYGISNHCSTIIKNISIFTEQINKHLHVNCDHIMEADYIDVYPEKSMPIYYCTKCSIQFH
jgi:hypothetical protein